MEFRKAALLVVVLLAFSWGTQGAIVRNYSKIFGPWQSCQLLLGGAMTASVRARFLNEETTDEQRVAIYQTMSHRAKVMLLTDLILPLPEHLTPEFALTWIGHLLNSIKPKDALEQNVVMAAAEHVIDVARGAPPNSDYAFPITTDLRVYALTVLEYVIEFHHMRAAQYEIILPGLSEILFGTGESISAPLAVKEKAVEVLEAITKDTTAPRDVHRVAYGLLERVESLSTSDE